MLLRSCCSPKGSDLNGCRGKRGDEDDNDSSDSLVYGGGGAATKAIERRLLLFRGSAAAPSTDLITTRTSLLSRLRDYCESHATPGRVNGSPTRTHTHAKLIERRTHARHTSSGDLGCESLQNDEHCGSIASPHRTIERTTRNWSCRARVCPPPLVYNVLSRRCRTERAAVAVVTAPLPTSGRGSRRQCRCYTGVTAAAVGERCQFVDFFVLHIVFFWLAHEKPRKKGAPPRVGTWKFTNVFFENVSNRPEKRRTETRRKPSERRHKNRFYSSVRRFYALVSLPKKCERDSAASSGEKRSVAACRRLTPDK